jgi:hypothetical protein
MSKFKSFAQQGSFRDYQIKAPDETGKIKEETARTIRGKERAQASLERQNNLYLQAQKLAQGVEENQREQNFRLETENRKAFLDALRRDNEIATRNDKIAAAQTADTFKQLSAFSKSAFELYGQYQELDLKRNQQENAKIAYAAGADYKTVVAIQALGDNLTKSEFQQTEFMRQKLAEGGNVDALFALYERRASKAFINNIGVAQNTAYSYHTAALQEQERFKKENPNATVDEQRANLKAFESEYAASFVSEDGRSMNANMLNTYVYPIMRRSQTQFLSNLDKEASKEQKSIVKQDNFKALNHAWGTAKSAGVAEWLTDTPSAEKFELFAEWVTNKSIDFSQDGLSSQDIESLRDFQYQGANYAQTGKLTSYGSSRAGLSDNATFNQALNTRKRAETTVYREGQANRQNEYEGIGIDIYNEIAADGSISNEDIIRLEENDKASGLPGFESKATALARKELDSVRFEDAYTQVFDDKLNKGTLTLQDLDQKGVSFTLKQKYAPLIQKQELLMQDQTYKDGVTAVGNAITEHPMVAKGRVGNKDHYSTILFKAEQLQQLKNDVLNGVPISEAVSGRLGIISSIQATTGAISPKGHYTKTVQSQAKGAVNYQEALQKDRDFIESSQTPNFRKDPAAAVNAYGENDFYEDYYPMQRGEVTPQLRRRAAIMGVSPLVAINFLAGGLSQPPVDMDTQVQAIADKITPITGRLVNTYRNSGSHLSRMSRAGRMMDGTLATAPTRLNQPLPPGVQGLAALVSSGEGSPTSMFPGENYPELLNMSIREVVQFQKQKLADGRASAAVGSYQFLYPEVAAQRAGLSLDDKFTPENQLKMFMGTLLNKPGRENLSTYLQGTGNDIEAAIDELAQEFASIEYRNGRSYYDKDGVNKASISRDRARAALMSARKELTNQ